MQKRYYPSLSDQLIRYSLKLFRIQRLAIGLAFGIAPAHFNSCVFVFKHQAARFNRVPMSIPRKAFNSA